MDGLVKIQKMLQDGKINNVEYEQRRIAIIDKHTNTIYRIGTPLEPTQATQTNLKILLPDKIPEPSDGRPDLHPNKWTGGRKAKLPKQSVELPEQKVDILKSGLAPTHKIVNLPSNVALPSDYQVIRKAVTEPKPKEPIDAKRVVWELMNAASNNEVRKIKELLDSGVYVDLRDYMTDNTAFIVAANRGQKHAMFYLLERGADIDAQNNRGDTALHSLINNRFTSLALQLVERGARIDIENSRNHTPFDLSLPWVQTQMKETVRKLASGELQVVKGPVEWEDHVAKIMNKPQPSAYKTQEAMKVYLKNGSYKTLIVNSETSAQDLYQMTAEKIGMEVWSSWLETTEVIRDQQRRCSPGENIFELRNRWPIIMGPKGNETPLHCKFYVTVKRGAPEAATYAYRDAMYGASTD